MPSKRGRLKSQFPSHSGRRRWRFRLSVFLPFPKKAVIVIACSSPVRNPICTFMDSFLILLSYLRLLLPYLRWAEFEFGFSFYPHNFIPSLRSYLAKQYYWMCMLILQSWLACQSQNKSCSFPPALEGIRDPEIHCMQSSKGRIWFLFWWMMSNATFHQA